MDCSELTRLFADKLVSDIRCFTDDESRTRLVMPFRRPGGDLIDVYVRQQLDGSFVVSDLGESLGFLSSMGYDPRAGTNSAYVLESLPPRYGVELGRDGVIRKHVPETELASAVQAVLETAIAVSHMLYLSRASVPTTIGDEVEALLVRVEVPFISGKTLIGESGKKFRLDFAVRGQKPNEGLEGLVKTLSAESASGRIQAVNSAFRLWSEVHSQAGMAASIVDDRYSEWAPEDIGALSKFSDVYLWGTDQDRFYDAVRRFAVGVA